MYTGNRCILLPPNTLTQNLDMDTVPEFWREYLRKWSFTLFSSENRTQALGVTIALTTRLFSALVFDSNSNWQPPVPRVLSYSASISIATEGWLVGSFAPAAIGQGNNFSFGITTLN